MNHPGECKNSPLKKKDGGVSMRVLALLACCVLVATWGAPRSAVADERTTLETRLTDGLTRFERDRDRIVAAAGSELAYDLQRRLREDGETLQEPASAGFSAAQWRETRANVVALDVDAIAMLAGGVPSTLAATPGLHEVLVRSRVDRTLQPVAIYVPPGLREGQRVPLAIVLHGRPQTESELLGQPVLRRLADASGTILLAPYGRGNYDFGEPAATDVYDLAAAARDALPVDPRRTYLVGYSMGGFSVFKIGARANARWAGIMCVSGAVLNSEITRVAFAWRDTPLYIVTGGRDESIPTAYGEQTASVLASLGVPVSFYEEPGAGHALRTLLPSLERAWSDMHAGTVRTGSAPASARGFASPSGGQPMVKD